MAKRQRKVGSYFDYGYEPSVGTQVWILVNKKVDRIEEIPVRGVIEQRSNIDERGLGNTYFDVRLNDGRLCHLPISQVFDHKPRMTEFEDQFGTFHKFA